MNQSEIMDAYLRARAAVLRMSATSLAQYYAPDTILKVAIMASEMPDEAVELVDPNVSGAISDLFNSDEVKRM